MKNPGEYAILDPSFVFESDFFFKENTDGKYTINGPANQSSHYHFSLLNVLWIVILDRGPVQGNRSVLRRE